MHNLTENSPSPEITKQRLSDLRGALLFIAGQGCEGDVGDYESCKHLPNNPCVTEWCLPCIAAQSLEDDDVLAEWQERRRGLQDHEA